MKYEYDICIVGGFGHVGLPLSIAFASEGKSVCALDISKEAYTTISSGKMPFVETGAEQLLKQVLKNGKLKLSLEPLSISKSKIIIVVIGTPIDYHMSPLPAVEQVMEKYAKYFRDGQLIVLRSTLQPGTTERIDRLLKGKGLKVDLAFCPERIVEGHALEELFRLPQMVSSTSKSGERRAAELFSVLTSRIIFVKPKEAELGKLFSNAWRYIKFSAANQFYMICNEAGLDYYDVYNAITQEYPRMMDLPRAGFTAGPCLYKDTAHLSTFYNHNFSLGNSAMMINEGLPLYIVNQLKKKYDLKKKSVGILGMAFKEGVDDKRDSLSYKLKTLLDLDAKKTYCSDVYIKEPGFLSMEELVKKSDIIVLGAPHKEYSQLSVPKGKVLVDIWNFYGNGGRI